jgi:hypothetical protein
MVLSPDVDTDIFFLRGAIKSPPIGSSHRKIDERELNPQRTTFSIIILAVVTFVVLNLK